MPLTVTSPRSLAPSKNSTFPVGVVVPLIGVTKAVSVIVAPSGAVVFDAVSLVAVCTSGIGSGAIANQAPEFLPVTAGPAVAAPVEVCTVATAREGEF